MNLRKKYKDAFTKKHGVGLGFMSLFTKAVTVALKDWPAVNAQLNGEEIIYHDYADIGIAVSTPKGLVVPVIRNADKLTIKEIALEIQNFSDKAKDGKLTLDDMKDGTFTITSYGSIGGLFAVPVINYPQAGILGIGRIDKKPVVKGENVVPGLVLPLSLSVDHRIADGGETARFINTIMGYLSDPVSIIME